MKKIISGISAVALTCSLALFPNSTSAATFTDVPTTHWAYPSINSLVEKGYITGISSTEFGINTDMTREEVANVLFNILADQEKIWNLDLTNPFNDISSSPYAFQIITVANNGYLSGKGDGKFDPNGTLTRAEMAVVISKVFDLQTVGATVNFSDVPSTHWAYPYVQKLVQNNVTSGTGNGKYSPNMKTTRAQFTGFLDRGMNVKTVEEPIVEEPIIEEPIIEEPPTSSTGDKSKSEWLALLDSNHNNKITISEVEDGGISLPVYKTELPNLYALMTDSDKDGVVGEKN